MQIAVPDLSREAWWQRSSGSPPEVVRHRARRAGAQPQRLAGGHQQGQQRGRVGRVRMHELHGARPQLALFAAHPHLPGQGLG